MKQKKGKGIIKAVIALALLAALGAGGAAAYANRSKKPVNVYTIRDQFAMTEYWGDSSQTDGMVGLEGIQQVYLSDTMRVRNVEVKEGQAVKAGDVLLNYDTTLTELDVQMKEVKMRQAELELTNAQKELATVKSYRADEYIPGSVTRTVIPGVKPEPEPPFVADGTLPLLGGKGTRKDPYVYLWKSSYSFDDAFFYQAMQGSKDCYVKLLLVGEGELPEHIHVPDQEEWHTDEESHWRICARCGEEYDKAEHTLLTVVDQMPGIEQEGSSHDVCGICGYEGEKTTIPALSKPEDDNPGTDNPGTDNPGTDNPGTDTPGTDEPGTDTPGSDTPESGTPESGTPVSGGGSSSPSTTTVEAELLIQLQNSSAAGYQMQVISINVPSAEDSSNPPLFLWKDTTPLPKLPPEEPVEEIPDEEVVDGIKYTAEELKEMRADAEAKVRDADLSLRQSKLEYEKAEKELHNSAIYAEMDGKVKELHTEDEAKETSSALLSITAGGGYYITCTLSELERDTVELGQTVTVTSWSTDGQYEGKITEISDYPSSSSNWGAGNSNVSYYPFTVMVSEDAGLKEGDYVGVQYGAAGAQQGFYLESMFIRTENGRSYVLMDQDGVLTKQYISTGRSLWGSYVQVLGGITPDAKLAFPYGKNTVEGAPTVEASADQLYGY